jgi:hypothetical protein
MLQVPRSRRAHASTDNHERGICSPRRPLLGLHPHHGSQAPGLGIVPAALVLRKSALAMMRAYDASASDLRLRPKTEEARAAGQGALSIRGVPFVTGRPYPIRRTISCLPSHSRTGGRHVTPTIDLEDRQWDVERFTNPLCELAFLPAAVICCAKGDQDVVGPKASNGVGESAQRRFVAHAAAGTGAWSQRVDLSQHGLQTLVGFVPYPIGIGGEPLKPTWEHGRDHEDLRGGFD